MSALCTLKYCIVLTSSRSVNSIRKDVKRKIPYHHWLLQFMKLKKPGKMKYLGKDNKGLLLKNTTTFNLWGKKQLKDDNVTRN